MANKPHVFRSPSSVQGGAYSSLSRPERRADSNRAGRRRAVAGRGVFVLRTIPRLAGSPGEMPPSWIPGGAEAQEPRGESVRLPRGERGVTPAIRGQSRSVQCLKLPTSCAFNIRAPLIFTEVLGFRLIPGTFHLPRMPDRSRRGQRHLVQQRHPGGWGGHRWGHDFLERLARRDRTVGMERRGLHRVQHRLQRPWHQSGGRGSGDEPECQGALQQGRTTRLPLRGESPAPRVAEGQPRRTHPFLSSLARREGDSQTAWLFRWRLDAGTGRESPPRAT